MKWETRGHVFSPAGTSNWARSHALIPTPSLEDDCIRVYFTSLDQERYGRVGFVDLDLDDPTRIIASSRNPVLDLGELGAFDDSGVNASSIVVEDDRTLLYYIGWQRTQRVPYMLFGGLAARGRDEEMFTRIRRVPILDRTDAEPFSRSAPFVLRTDSGYSMWYWSCTSWDPGEAGELARYRTVIKTAVSSDGIDWKAAESPVVVPKGADEYAVGRPWVIRSDGFQMWYSIRSSGRRYRIAYAESEDGRSWVYDLDSGIDVSESGWDSQMVCFPAVLDVGGRRLLFYNGNDYGRTGFGVAEAVEG